MQWDKERFANGFGLVNRFGHDDDDNLVLHTVQDVEPILEANKTFQNQGNNGFGATRELRHIASIPLGTHLEWLQLGIDIVTMRMKIGGKWVHAPQEVETWLRRRLRDPDYRFLKTASGNV